MTGAFLPPLSHNLGAVPRRSSSEQSSAPGADSWSSRDNADRLGGCRQPEVRRVGRGVSLELSRVLLEQLRRLDQVSSATAWIRLGECLYRITLGLVGPDELAARSLGGVGAGGGSWRTTHRFGGPQKRTPWLNREVLSCRWRLRRHLLQGIGCTAGSAKALLNRAMVGATGVEPVTSSVSAKPREPLC